MDGVVKAGALPEGALDAAMQFHRTVLPRIRTSLPGAGDVVVLFEPAEHDHCGWRLAAIQSLAREAAPARVNAIVGTQAGDIAHAREFLARSPGITGQVLTLDGKSDENG